MKSPWYLAKGLMKSLIRAIQEEWGTSAWVGQETIRAVVEAYGEGKIELLPPNPNASAHHIRYAPSFCTGNRPAPGPDTPYTALSVSQFLGWTYSDKNGGTYAQDKVTHALAALQFIEEGILKEEDFYGLMFPFMVSLSDHCDYGAHARVPLLPPS